MLLLLVAEKSPARGAVLGLIQEPFFFFVSFAAGGEHCSGLSRAGHVHHKQLGRGALRCRPLGLGMFSPSGLLNTSCSCIPHLPQRKGPLQGSFLIHAEAPQHRSSTAHQQPPARWLPPNHHLSLHPRLAVTAGQIPAALMFSPSQPRLLDLPAAQSPATQAGAVAGCHSREAILPCTNWS